MARYTPPKSLIDMVFPHKFLPGPSEITAAATWGGVAGFGALWMIQPWDWLKAQMGSAPKDS